MSRYVFKMPELGEGTVTAEVVEWKVKVGDIVKEDQIIAEVMTDKAAVEIPAPVSGRVVSLTGAPGDMVAVGAELIAFETGESATEGAAAKAVAPAPPAKPAPAAEDPDFGATTRIMASPATRRKAQDAGVDLAKVSGTGPGGRISAGDLDAVIAGKSTPAARPAVRSAREGTEEIKVIGVRRVIAERMSQSKREIPHFAYVEEVDVTELEALRLHLTATGEHRVTVLPFIAAGLVRALAEFPQCNARYDAERGMLQRFRPVHLGIATQTPDGLKVPVVRNAEQMNLWQLAAEISRVAEAAREGKAARGELSGSTITITSLGRMGGIVTTPVINYPEVGIIGVNKAVERPMVLEGQVRVRTMMNLSSSFDHRFVDGFDAAAMIQKLKGLLEHPATLFLETL